MAGSTVTCGVVFARPVQVIVRLCTAKLHLFCPELSRTNLSESHGQTLLKHLVLQWLQHDALRQLVANMFCTHAMGTTAADAVNMQNMALSQEPAGMVRQVDE